MLNLIDYLSPTEYKRIENYILTYGVEDNYKGNEKYLENWNASKKKLFRLFGGKLVVKIPFQYEKDKNHILSELNLLRSKYAFFVRDYEILLDKYTQNNNLKYTDFRAFYDAISYASIAEDKISTAIKYTRSDNGRTIQLQAGMKPMRAIQKTIDFFGFDTLKEEYEKFRIEHSLIYNEKLVKGNLCFSIDPIDFMTMSDNDSGWSSCMSWTKASCYHVGSVEMMNSNNVICAYIESKKPFYFDKNNNSQDAEWSCPNKKWRQLFYVTKDIIVGGKSYPYTNEYITKLALDNLRELAKANWNVTYSFGPELYKDMRHIGSMYRFDKNRDWVRTNTSIKHNILFDSKGMYNDMFNDHATHYWCIRNKVDREKIICYSGKAKCLCCNNDVIDDNEDYYYYDEGSYNDRFSNCGNVLCYNCMRDRECDFCGNVTGYHKVHEINGNLVCSDCINKKARLCPDCGEVFMPSNNLEDAAYIRFTSETIFNTDIRAIFYRDREVDSNIINNPKTDGNKAVTAFLCNSCLEKSEMFEKVTIPKHPQDYFWHTAYSDIAVTKKVYNKDDPSIKRYLFNFLQKVDKNKIIDFN